METSLQQLHEARKRLVPFVGTGVSIQASGNPAATWPGLLRSGIEECATFCPDLPRGWRASMHDRQENGDLFSYLAIADEIHRRLDVEGRFTSWIRRVGNEITLRDSSVLDPLVKISELVVTTNYDTLIEQAFGDCGKTAETIEIGGFAKFRKRNLESRPAVLHLHGSTDGEIVLSASQYQKIALDEGAQKVQEHVLAASQLLFVGVGEGLNDPNIGGSVDALARFIDQADDPHFLLVRGREISDARQRHRGRPIVPIAYGDEYGDLAPFLAALADGEVMQVPQEPSAFSIESPVLRVGALNIAAFAEERIEDLLEAARRSLRALQQVQSRIDLPVGFDSKRPTDQLVILQQQVASIHGPVSRLTRSIATISHCSEAAEAELSKIAADRGSLDGFPSIMGDLMVVGEQLTSLREVAEKVSEIATSRVRACQDFHEAAQTLRTVATRALDSAEEIAGLIEQLQDQDAPSATDR